MMMMMMMMMMMWKENCSGLVEALTLHLHGGTQENAHKLRRGSQCPGRILYESVVYLMTPSTVMNDYDTISSCGWWNFGKPQSGWLVYCLKI
jgi:hypothetical protein